MAWNSGYITDVNYTFGYYAELNPVRAAAAAVGLGVKTLPVKNACELGFGQGLSINIHAAAQPGIQWWGNDFNPAQAAFAQELTRKAGSGAMLSDEAFAEFCARTDLPEFEFIALHGIWSWVSDENRQIIIDFVRRKLAVGGMLYISYNAMPGWAAPAPWRHLIKTHGDIMASPATIITQRIDQALSFIDQLLTLQPGFTRANPLAEERFKGLKNHNRDYLAHEYMNHEWQPMYFTEVAKWLEPAKISFAGSMNFIEQQDAVNLTPPQIALLQQLGDVAMRETARDYIVNQQFRRDVWMRGLRPMSASEHLRGYRTQKWILSIPRDDVPKKVAGLQGEADLNELIYGSVVEFLADHQIRTGHEIEQAMGEKGVNTAQVMSALGLLAGLNAVSPVQDEKATAKARTSTDKLNAAIFQEALSRGDISFLASPVTGGGVNVGRFDQLFLLARSQGRKTPTDWAEFAVQVLFGQGQRLLKGGKELRTVEENQAELLVHAQALYDKKLPILKALGVV